MKSALDKNTDIIKASTVEFLAKNMTAKKMQEVYDKMTPNQQGIFLTKMLERVVPKPEQKKNSGLSTLDMVEMMFNQMIDKESKAHNGQRL